MNVVLIGSGGREHAIAYKISKSSQLSKLYVLPGNAGTALLAENIQIDILDFKSILNFCIKNKIDLVIVGPEQPLVNGIADFLRENNILVFGPNKSAAILEGDKSFAKYFMKKYSIPTADFEVFNIDEADLALEYLRKSQFPIVIKASGLAAGKGVLICDNYSEAESAVKLCFEDKKFGDSGSKIVIEEFLRGHEVSIFAITDGTDYLILPPSQDHKAIYDGDKGPNTGGMGAYSPVSLSNIYKSINSKMSKYSEQNIEEYYLADIEDLIVKPTISALRKENKLFNGCLYCGLMITEQGPKVIEYNCRFGDPETQAVLLTIEGDFLELLKSTAAESINKKSVIYNGGASVAVVAVSDGYPNSYKKGFEIFGLSDISKESVIVFHSGTKVINEKVITNGGRVLCASSFVNNNSINDAKIMCYNELSKIKYSGISYRHDISDKSYKMKNLNK